MTNWLTLKTRLENLTDHKIKVYFQPPESIKLSYPCIIVERSVFEYDRADNAKYRKMGNYTVTLITHEFDDTLVDILADAAGIVHDRAFVADNLYHNVYKIRQQESYLGG